MRERKKNGETLFEFNQKLNNAYSIATLPNHVRFSYIHLSFFPANKNI